MTEDEIAYAEVFEILSYMDRATVMKIPLEILQYIKDNRNIEYVSRINPNNFFNKENVSDKAREILAWIDLEYLVSDKNKTEKLKRYIDNEKEYQINLNKQYSYDKLFENKTIRKSKDTEELAIVKKQNIFNKILNFIKNIFNIDNNIIKLLKR